VKTVSNKNSLHTFRAAAKKYEQFKLAKNDRKKKQFNENCISPPYGINKLKCKFHQNRFECLATYVLGDSGALNYMWLVRIGGIQLTLSCTITDNYIPHIGTDTL